MNRARTVCVGAIVAALTLTAACASSGGTSSTSVSGNITVLAASSLTEVFATIATQFEKKYPGTKVTYSFGGSPDLATEIVNGNPADVFASASPATMQTVQKAGDTTSVATFAKNTMEIAAAPGNPAHIDKVADLARHGVKVALCEPTVPCGVAAAQVLANVGVKVDPTASEPDVKSTLAQIETGEVDAGIVYVSDVKSAGHKVVGVPIPEELNAITAYPITVLKHSKNAATARAFVAYVRSSAGQAVLRANGFAAP